MFFFLFYFSIIFRILLVVRYLKVVVMLSSYSSFGFGGSRSASPSCLAEARRILSALPPSAQIVTTCGRGVPSLAAARPGAVVFRASDLPSLGRAAFAARASAAVRHLARQPRPLFVCFPARPAPAPIRPGLRSWQSCGSGSWSEVALAAGLGVPVLVFLPAGIQPPASLGAWQLVRPGWFLLPSPSLF